MERDLDIYSFEGALKEPDLDVLKRKCNHCLHTLERLFFLFYFIYLFFKLRYH